jgi:hypothetical protein
MYCCEYSSSSSSSWSNSSCSSSSSTIFLGRWTGGYGGYVRQVHRPCYWPGTNIIRKWKPVKLNRDCRDPRTYNYF